MKLQQAENLAGILAKAHKEPITVLQDKIDKSYWVEIYRVYKRFHSFDYDKLIFVVT